MDQQRGRSPSVGRQPSHINHSHSPSPQHYQENVNTADLGLGLDTSLNQPYPSSNYPTSHGLPAYNQSFLSSNQGQQFNQSNISEGNFVQNPDYTQQSDFDQQFKQEDLQQNQSSISPYSQQQETSFTQQLLNTNNYNEGDFSLYSTPSGQGDFRCYVLLERTNSTTIRSVNKSSRHHERYVIAAGAHAYTSSHAAIRWATAIFSTSFASFQSASIPTISWTFPKCFISSRKCCIPSGPRTPRMEYDGCSIYDSPKIAL